MHHDQIVHAEDGFKDGPHIFGADGSVGIDSDGAGAGDARIEDVVDMKIARQDIDHIEQRRVRQIEATGDGGGGRGGNRGGWRLSRRYLDEQQTTDQEHRERRTKGMNHYCFF